MIITHQLLCEKNIITYVSTFDEGDWALSTKGMLTSLEMEDRTKVFKPSEIYSATIAHFQKLFSAPSLNNYARDFSTIVDKVLPPEKSAELMRSVTDEEIKTAIFKMNPDKAPGPNGYTTGFFHKLCI